MSARTYAETIARINAIVEDMSALQKEKRRLVKRLMYDLKPPQMSTSDTQSELTINPKSISTADVMRVKRTHSSSNTERH